MSSETSFSQKIGLHASAAGGVENAPQNAYKLGAECFQFFSRSPRGGSTPAITLEQAQLFKERSNKYGLESYIHAPYYINFASKNQKIYHGSSSAIREELIRGTKLGVKYVMTHLGSAADWLSKSQSKNTLSDEIINYATAGLKRIFETEEELTTNLLLEISAGAGAVLGDNLEDLARLLEGIGRDDVYICLDTCHLFASGYDLRTAAAIEDTLDQFKHTIGLKRLKLVHANDSKTNLGSHKDRHEHIGQGFIGEEGFKNIISNPHLQHVNFILETPHDSILPKDLALLKSYRHASK